MQKLTLEEVKAAARDYYERNMLIAQRVDPDAERTCIYQREDGCRCALGAALSDETLMTIRSLGLNGKGLFTLRANNIVSVENEEEMRAILAIQIAHDDWAHDSNSITAYHENRFKELIR